MRSRWLSFATLLFMFAAPMLRGSFAVTPGDSPTTENLLGGCYGNGQFVIVGQNGVVLTSPDGMAFTERNSGVTVALRSVTYSSELGLYVAVGDEGTIRSSIDGIAWTARQSNTTSRLNAIAAGGGLFLAAGENGTVVTSPDGVTWTTRSTGVTESLPAVTYGKGQFVIAAGVNRVLTTLDGVGFSSHNAVPGAVFQTLAFNGETFFGGGTGGVTAMTTDPTQWPSLGPGPSHWLVVSAAAFGDRFIYLLLRPNSFFYTSGDDFSIAVYNTRNAIIAGPDVALLTGDGGAISRVTLRPPSVTVSAEGASVLGHPLRLIAHASENPPFSYQWRKDQQALPGATSATFTIAELQVSHAGNYDVVVSNLGGSTTSVTLPVVVYPDAPPGLAAGRAFRSSLTVAAPRRIAVQPDGKVLVSGRFRVSGPTSTYLNYQRLNLDGTIDSTFQAPYRTTLDSPAFRINADADGSTVFTYAGTVRLRNDGSLDPGYPPDAFRVQDGFVGLKLNVYTLKVSRYQSDATPIDQTDISLVTQPSPPGLVFSDLRHSEDGQGRLLISVAAHQAWSGTSVDGVKLTVLLRLLSNGALDPTFSQRSLNRTLTDIWCHPITGQIYYQATAFATDSGPDRVTSFGRLNADGSEDSSYPVLEFDEIVGGQPTVSTFGQSLDGSLIVTSESLRNGDMTTLVRYDTDGVLDPSFLAVAHDLRFGIDSERWEIAQLTTAPGGSLMALKQSVMEPAGDPFTPPRAEVMQIFPVTDNPAARLINLSIRASSGANDATLIIGSVVAGGSGQSALLRAVGPTLQQFGVSNTLADPQLTLFRDQDALLSNDDWSKGGDSAAIAAAGSRVGAFGLPSDSKDAALFTDLPLGKLTLHVTGSPAGVVLGEIYDALPGPFSGDSPRLINVSARTTAGTGEATLIAGIVLGGQSAQQILIRAIGPSLAGFNVQGVLADPFLRLYSQTEAIAANDDWGGSATLTAAFADTQAFSLAADSKDAALLVTLNPGLYTIHVTGADTSPGIALVEVYAVP